MRWFISVGSARGREIGDPAWRGARTVDASWLRDLYDFCNSCSFPFKCQKKLYLSKKLQHLPERKPIAARWYHPNWKHQDFSTLGDWLQWLGGKIMRKYPTGVQSSILWNQTSRFYTLLSPKFDTLGPKKEIFGTNWKFWPWRGLWYRYSELVYMQGGSLHQTMAWLPHGGKIKIFAVVISGEKTNLYPLTSKLFPRDYW